MTEKLLVDVKELAELLGVSVRQCWRMRDSGHLPPPLQIGGKKSLRWAKRGVIEEWISAGAPHCRKTGWIPGKGARS